MYHSIRMQASPYGPAAAHRWLQVFDHGCSLSAIHTHKAYLEAEVDLQAAAVLLSVHDLLLP